MQQKGMPMGYGIDYAVVLKKALSSGGEYADVYIERSTPFSLVCEDGKIEKVLSGIDQGAGVRVIFGDRTAYAYTNELTLDSLLEIADAVQQAVKQKGDQREISLVRKHPAVDYSIRTAPETVSVAEKTAMIKQANAAARSFDPRIRQAM